MRQCLLRQFEARTFLQDTSVHYWTLQGNMFQGYTDNLCPCPCLSACCKHIHHASLILFSLNYYDPELIFTLQLALAGSLKC